MNVLQLVTARGGSKGVHKKNLAEIAGIPLVGYKIISAMRSNYNQFIVVSTDSKEIADISKRYGAEIPFIRPAHLATDNASSMDVIEHTLDWFERNRNITFDAVSLLEPSSPFSTYQQINEAIELFVESGVDSVIGIVEHKVNPIFIHTLGENNQLEHFYNAIKDNTKLRRQDFDKTYTLSGALYVFSASYFKRTKQIISKNSIGYILDDNYGLEIDHIDELEYARYLADTGKIKLDPWR